MRILFSPLKYCKISCAFVYTSKNMPELSAPSNGDSLSSSGMISCNYFNYDQPPGPDGCKEEAYLPSRRRSWVDVVDQCSEHTEGISITDLSSLAESRHSASSRGCRRRSWEQLIEENEQNGLVDIAMDFTKPQPPPLPVPYANPALHMMTIRGDGRLARVHLYNKKNNNSNVENEKIDNGKTQISKREGSSGSSKTSTMSEFILVPSKTVIPSSSTSSLNEDGGYRHDFGKMKSRICPWTPSRGTVFAMVLTMALLLTSAVGGYLIRRYVAGTRTEYELTFPTYQDGRVWNDQSPTTLRVVITEPNNAEFSIQGSFPYQQVKTVIDFDKKNTPVAWVEDWYWQVEAISDTLRGSAPLNEESKSQCENIYWLRRINRDTSSARCVQCTAVCVPTYGVVHQSGPLLVPVGRHCFWLSSGPDPAKPFVNKVVPYLPGTNFPSPPVYQQQRQWPLTGTRPQYQTAFFPHPNQRTVFNPVPPWTNYQPIGPFRRSR